MGPNENQIPPTNATAYKSIFWRTLPISRNKALLLIGCLLYFSILADYVVLYNYPIRIHPVEIIVYCIFAIPVFLLMFLPLWGIPAIILRIIHRFRFKTPLPQKTYIAEFSWVIVMTLFFCGYNIYYNINRPVQSLENCLMDGKPLPASAKNISHYYSKCPNSDFLGIWTFEIDPAELNQLLQARKYNKITVGSDFNCKDITGYWEFPDKSKLPSVPMTQCFSYPNTDGQEKPSVLYTKIFTDATGSKIVVVQYRT